MDDLDLIIMELFEDASAPLEAKEVATMINGKSEKEIPTKRIRHRLNSLANYGFLTKESRERCVGQSIYLYSLSMEAKS